MNFPVSIAFLVTGGGGLGGVATGEVGKRGADLEQPGDATEGWQGARVTAFIPGDGQRPNGHPEPP